ncbi:MAG: FtsX-like permease family protein [Mobilitalea sp.]
MMGLNKRIKRDIKYNRSFYISASLLTAISVFLLITCYSILPMLDNGFQEVMKKGNVENAQFTTLQPIEDEDISNIEDTFKVNLEKIQYVDLKETEYTLRVFAPTDKINCYQMLEGKDISTEDEILLNRDFAVAHKISLGDSVAVGDKCYVVTGLAVRPDYLYAQMEITDFYLNDSYFGQVTMSQKAFDQLDGTQSYYSIVYQEDNDIEVRQYIYDKYNSIKYMSSEANSRISMASDISKEYGIMVAILIPVMFIMIAIIVAVVMGRMVKKEQKQIGTLVALGYRKGEIIRHYSSFPILPGFFGSIIGIILSIFFLKPFTLYMSTDFETINFVPELHAVSFVIAILAPASLYFFTALWNVERLLRKNTVQILIGNADGDRKRISRFLAKSKLSFRNKFRFRSLIGNITRTFVVIMGMFIGGFLCALGLIMVDSCNYQIERGMDEAGSYEYIYYLNTILTQSPKSGEPMLATNFEVEGQTDLFKLCGIQENPKYLDLNLLSKEQLEYGKYYMTSNAAALYDVEAGDDFTFINSLTTMKYTITVEDIIDDNTQCNLYTSTSKVAKLLGLQQGSYNVLMSDKELDIDKNIVALENTKENLKKQFEVAIDLFMGLIYTLIIFGAVLCIITVYLTVNMIVQENRINISMLKVLGYRTKEINNLVLNTNHILLPISYVFSIISCMKLCEVVFKQFVSKINVYIQPVITITSMLICLVTLVLSYYISLFMLKRKVVRVNMVESLKDNRE